MKNTEASKNYHSRTATLYSASLEDGDFHSKGHSFAAYLLGLITPFPEKMRVNRAFGQSMYKRFAKEGFKNIIDIGSGPMPRGHEWANGARILYMDHNPDIVNHARKKLRESDNAVYEVSSAGDIKKNFDAGMGDRVFGDDRKVAIGSNAVLMFVSDEDIKSAFSKLYDWAAPGSVVEITMTGITAKETHFRAKMIRRFFSMIDAPMHIRNIDRFKELLAPWELEKGPTPTWQWVNWPPSKNTAGIGFDIYAMRLVKK